MMDQVKSGRGTIGYPRLRPEGGRRHQGVHREHPRVSDKLASGQGTLGKLINDESLFNSAQVTIKKVDRTLDGLNDSGPITAVGIVANALF
jgi:phospholipid/cholesterol/gamma-HCH transport system substrate-binding protein